MATFRETTPVESDWFVCLAAIDDVLAHGYHDETLNSLGSGKHAGLQTMFKLCIGKFTTPTLTIRFTVRNADRRYTVLTLVCPLDALDGDLVVNSIKPDAVESIGELLFQIPSIPVGDHLGGTKSMKDKWLT